jgi:tetratricopeptide (TPR) repeat protein
MTQPSWYSRLVSLLEDGKTEEALLWLEAQKPANALIWHEKSRVLCTLGRLNEALQAANSALELDPDNPVYLVERATVYIHLRRYGLALLDMDRAVILAPDNPYPLACRAYLKDLTGNTEGAVDDYQKALALDPDDAVLHNNLGLLWEKLGWKQKSGDLFAKADQLAREMGLFLEPVEKSLHQTESPPAGEAAVPLTRWAILKGLFNNATLRKEFLTFILQLLRLRNKNS